MTLQHTPDHTDTGNPLQHRVRCVRLRPMSKNTLRAFVDLELVELGLVVKDCTWHIKDGKEWIGLPARTYEDNTGERRWAPTVDFAPDAKRLRWAFQDAALTAVKGFDGGLA